MAYEEIVTTGNIPGISVKSKTSYITAKTTGDYTWLSETDISGGAVSGAKGIAVSLAADADTVDGKHASDFATSDHSHGLSHTNLFTYIDSTNELMSMNDIPYMANVLKAFRTQQNAPSWAINNFSAGIAFGGADTKGIITHRYDYPEIKFAGGSGDVANWTLSISGSSGQVYDLNRVPNIMTRGVNPDGFSYQLANDGGIYNIKVMAYGSTDEYNAYIVNNILYIVRVGNGGWEGLFSGGISTSGDVLNFGFKDWTYYVITKFVNWNA